MEPRQEDKRIRFSIDVTERQAGRLAQILRRAAETEPNPEDAAKFRDIVYMIRDKGGTPYRHKRPVRRPIENDEVAVQRVLKGEHPYPVLSRADARHVFAVMDKQGKSARDIAECLYVDRATITRWRRERRTGQWKVTDG